MYIKGNHKQNKVSQQAAGEDICNAHNKGLFFQKIWKTPKTQDKYLNKNLGKDIKRQFTSAEISFKERNYFAINSKRTSEKMFKLISN